MEITAKEFYQISAKEIAALLDVTNEERLEDIEIYLETGVEQLTTSMNSQPQSRMPKSNKYFNYPAQDNEKALNVFANTARCSAAVKTRYKTDVANEIAFGPMSHMVAEDVQKILITAYNTYKNA